MLRDAEGEVLLAASKKEHEVNDQVEVEQLATLRGLQLCLPLGLRNSY